MNPDSLIHKDTWTLRHRNLVLEISNHGKGNPRHNDGKGTWCYYIHIHEQPAGPKFSDLWIEPTLRTDWSRPRVAHPDYDSSLIASFSWHCGITYYDTSNATHPGVRHIQAGCDYSHLWDMEAGYPADKETLFLDGLQTLNEIADFLGLDDKGNLNTQPV